MSIDAHYRERLITGWEQIPALPIFMQPWYMDLLAKDQWGVVLNEDSSGQINGIHTYFIQRKWGQTFLLPMPLCPYSGIWYRYPDGGKMKAHTQLSFRHTIITALFDRLPSAKITVQRLRPGQTDILPLLWKKWQQHVRFTFVLQGPLDQEAVLSGMKSTLRNKIRSAEKHFTISQNVDLAQSTRLFQMKLQEKKAHFAYSDQQISAWMQACISRNHGICLSAHYPDNSMAATAFFVWDDESYYYLLSGNLAGSMDKGANALLIWEGIKLAATKKLNFNFEGGMSEGIGNYFAGFGAEPQPYLQVNRCVNAFWTFIGKFRFGI